MIWNPFRWFAARQKAAFDRATAEHQRQLDAYATFVQKMRENPMPIVHPRRVGKSPELSAPYGEPRTRRYDDDSSSSLLDTVVTIAAVDAVIDMFDSSPSTFDSSPSSDSFSGGGGDFGGGGSSGDW